MLRTELQYARSNKGIIRSKIDVKTWVTSPPTVSEARPSSCTSCRAASRPTGEQLVVRGHGVCHRQIRGPPTVDGAPTIIVVVVRRYRCRACGAVMTVVPREVLPGFWYAAPAIAVALALYGVQGASAREVRRRVCAWPIVGTSTGWPSLRRWIRRSSSLWRCVRASPAQWSTRQRAERAATIVAAHAEQHGDLVERAFAGAAHAR